MTEDAMKRPPTIALTDEEQKTFAALTERQIALAARQQAVRDFLKSVVTTGEARLTEINVEANKLGGDLRRLWEGLAKKHRIDLNAVAYDLTDDGKSIEPKSVRL